MLDLRRWLIAGAAALAACSADPLLATGTLRTETFHSAIVDDDYILRIRLPPDYQDSTATYPLIIQLDPTYAGLEEYAITVGLVSHHAELGEWPEAIVVGVDYPHPPTRERDYVPELPLDPQWGNAGADRFYRVLRDEILPHIEAEYRVDPIRRVLVGHSNGGVFAWYASFRHAPPEPPLFAAAIAADCGYDEALFTLERWHAERSDSLPMRIYASQALYNGAAQKVVFDAMMTRLRERDYAGLELVFEQLDTDHGGAIVPSFEAGLGHALGVLP
ncbi:MAG: alpha/beta hydrolase-fold protein [Enhygromyxa sp.]